VSRQALIEQLREAVLADDRVAIARWVRRHPAEIEHAKDEQGRTPLHWATHHGCYGAAQELIQSGFDLYARDIAGQLPFDFEPGGSKNKARWLLRCRHEDNQLFLSQLKQWPESEITAALEYDRGRARARTLDGRTALMISSASGRAEIVRRLLDAGADPGAADWVEGYDAVFVSVAEGHVDCLGLLLAAAPELGYRSWRIWYGDSPAMMAALHVASWRGHLTVVDSLLGKLETPDLRTAGDGRVLTALHLASTAGHVEIVKRLLQAGADPAAVDGWRGFNALQMAMETGNDAIVTVLREWAAERNVNLLRPLYEQPSDAGIAFPLYLAPLDEHRRHCVTCRTVRTYCFHVSHLIRICRHCPEAIGFGIDQAGIPVRCRRCGAENEWPSEWPHDQIRVCYECLRSGRASVSHSTELGLVDFPTSQDGMARGGDFETAAMHRLKTSVLKRFDDGSELIGTHVPHEVLQELLRTPRHPALQNEYWPFHCGDFMAFLGNWEQDDFERQAPGCGREWFAEHMQSEDWEDMWEWLPSGIGWSYVYQCRSCGKHRVFVDSD
jgi:uncharacterized protein